MPLTRELGGFVAGLIFERLPAAAVDVARIGFIDTIATMIAGSRDEAPQLLKKALAPPAGDATLYFTGETAPAPEAAWINGTAAHALDYDDVAVRGHPSTVLVPAILAEGEALGASGAALITAYVAGYEAWAELSRRDPGHHHRKGWHPTGIFGTIAAAAACASLRRLDTAKTAMALALAASQSSGLMANFGTMTKPFHAGRAAHSGLVSARLAAAGFTAATDALEHPQGFLSAVSPEGLADRDSPAALGKPWHIVENRLSIKKYPACYALHRSIDGLLDVLKQRPLEPEDIESITASISKTRAMILRNHQPQTGLEGKFSMEFAMAAAVIARRASLAEFNDGFVRRPDVQALMRKVSIDANENYDPEVSGAAVFDQVRVQLTNGETLESAQVRRARGAAELPLSDAELFEKFGTCLGAGHARIAPEILFGRLKNLEHLSARELTAA
ncbi:MAG TPA: MmgE/PrpD family protein [Stellaceae bacterium]|jgi:2-methylcitrate dehydratase PrpD|nr:MmgE/PrpD family protein [Stellaceae bacterium]